jgi:AcrR family transcriptional regulator
VTPVTQAEAARRRRMPASERRQVILAAALEAFAERGFDEVTLDEVATRAGVSKALIYEHFASKRELTRALLDTYVHELLGRLAEAIATAEPGEERMRTGVDAVLRFVEERPGAWRMLFRNSADPDIADLFRALQAEAATAIASAMAADATEVGTAPPPSPAQIEMLAQQLSGAVQAIATWWTDHPSVTRADVLETVMDFCWLGFERLGDGERWSFGDSRG